MVFNLEVIVYCFCSDNSVLFYTKFDFRCRGRCSNIFALSPSCDEPVYRLRHSFVSPYVVCLQLRLKKIGMQNCRQTPIHKHMVHHGKLLCRTLLTYLCPHDAMSLCGVLSKWLNGSRLQLFQTGPAIVSL